MGTKTVFICNQTQLISISLGTKQNELISKQKSELLATFAPDRNGRVGQVFYIPKSKQIHIINYNTHYIMDLCRNMPSNMHRVIRASVIFEDEPNIYLDPGSMMYIKSKQSLIGRRFKVDYGDITSVEISNSISEYSLVSNQWFHYKQWIPLQLIGRVGRSVITRSEDYIFSVGAQKWKSSESDFDDIRKILIYDVNTNEFDLSALEIPSDQLSFISLTNNTQRDDLLVFGFCRFGPDLSGYSKHLSMDIVGLLTKWICFETVHFVADNPDKDVADHWIVDVDNILATKQCIEWKENQKVDNGENQKTNTNS